MAHSVNKALMSPSSHENRLKFMGWISNYLNYIDVIGIIRQTGFLSGSEIQESFTHNALNMLFVFLHPLLDMLFVRISAVIDRSRRSMQPIRFLEHQKTIVQELFLVE